MSQKNDKGLKFEQELVTQAASSKVQASRRSDPQLRNISRRSYRIPLNITSPIKVRIRGQEFEPVNIMSHGRSGIGITVRTKELFGVGEELPVQLVLPTATLTLEGTVRHVSPNSHGNYLCGIEFTRLTREDQQTIKEFCDSCHAALFSTK